MKKLLISLLIGFVLFATIPAYAFISGEEARTYIGETILVISRRTEGAIGRVISVDTYIRPGFGSETFLVMIGFDKKLYVFPILSIVRIQKVDMFGFPTEEKSKIIER